MGVSYKDSQESPLTVHKGIILAKGCPEYEETPHGERHPPIVDHTPVVTRKFIPLSTTINHDKMVY